VQLRHRQQADGIDLDALATRLGKHGPVDSNEFMLRAHITESNKRFEITLFRDGRAIVKGTDEPRVARSVYAKYVGS
jgi:adenylyltransferase/sulfurtransferase